MNVAEGEQPTVTVDVERKGMSLWVYWIVKEEGREERIPLRELNWVFAEEEGWSVGFGGFVARETEGEGRDELEARFGDGMVVEVSVG